MRISDSEMATPQRAQKILLTSFTLEKNSSYQLYYHIILKEYLGQLLKEFCSILPTNQVSLLERSDLDKINVF